MDIKVLSEKWTAKLKGLKPPELLKVSSAILSMMVISHVFIHFFARSRGYKESALFSMMKSYEFSVLGLTRSHWDFYQGYSLFMILGISTQIVLLWFLGDLLKSVSKLAGPLVLTLFISTLFLSLLCWWYYFSSAAFLATMAALFSGRAFALLQRTTKL